MSKRETFRVNVPYFVEAYVTPGPGHSSMQRVKNISGNSLSFLSNRKIKTGKIIQIRLHFPHIFDPLSVEAEVVRVHESRQPAMGKKKPVKKWDVCCRFKNPTIAQEAAAFQIVRFLERREISYRRNGLHRVDIPDDLRLFMSYGHEWYRVRYKVKNLSENGLLYESYSLLEPGTRKPAYLGFPWTTELQRLSLGVVRFCEKKTKKRQSTEPLYEIGCRLENLHEHTQEKLYDHINHMKRYGVSPKIRVPPVR